YPATGRRNPLSHCRRASCIPKALWRLQRRSEEGGYAGSRPRPRQPIREELAGPVPFENGPILAHDDRGSAEAILVGEGLVGIEPRGIARLAARERLPGVSCMKRLGAVLGAIDFVGDVAATEHRDRTLDDTHVHGGERVAERAAIAAPKVAEDRDR